MELKYIIIMYYYCLKRLSIDTMPVAKLLACHFCETADNIMVFDHLPVALLSLPSMTKFMHLNFSSTLKVLELHVVTIRSL